MEGNSKLMSGKLSEAVKDYTAALRVVENDSKTTTILVNRALAHFRLSLYKNAIKDCDTAIEADSTFLRAYWLKGKALKAQNKPNRAVNTWKNALQLCASDGDVVLLEEISGLIEAHNAANDISVALNTSNSVNSSILQGGVAESPSQSGTTSSPATRMQLTGKGKEKQEAAAVTVTEDTNVFSSISSANIGNADSAATLVAKEGLVQHGIGNSAVDEQIAKGYLLVNTGNFQNAISHFSTIIEKHPNAVGAWLGRGTAEALSGNIRQAIKEFGGGIRAHPKAADAWKRRGQARAAINDHIGALSDLTHALTLEEDSDTFYQRGLVYHGMQNYRQSVVDFGHAVRLDATHKMAINFHGLAKNCLGDCEEAIIEYKKAVKVDESFKEAISNMAQAYKDLGKRALAEQYFAQTLLCDPTYVHAIHLRAVLRHSCGEVSKCIGDLRIALELDRANIECITLLGVAYHSLGMYSNAIRQYDTILSSSPTHHAWYLRQMAMYHRSVLEKRVSNPDYVIDCDIDERVKEGWAKKHDPRTLAGLGVEQPGSLMQSNVSDVFKSVVEVGSVGEGEGEGVDLLLKETVDEIGSLIQYTSAGFLPNRRQHLTAGIAVINLAQELYSVMGRVFRDGLYEVKGNGKVEEEKGKTMKKNKKGKHGRKGKNGKVEGEGEGGEGMGCMGYRDAFQVLVKWRQLSEPNDPVWWVDMLTKQQFSEGFGSHTPMFSGQTKVVRYYCQFDRAFALLKKLLKIQLKLESGSGSGGGGNVSASVLDRIEAVSSVGEVYNIVGRDFWVITPCQSRSRPEHVLEGTRLTVQVTPPNGHEFSIRTPCTPSRWREYDIELSHAWDVFLQKSAEYQQCKCECKQEEKDALTLSLSSLTDSILDIAFYWYNFMPLARGSAFCGYTMILALFSVNGLEVTASIPVKLQVDWEAILNDHPDKFINEVKPWILKSLKRSDRLINESVPRMSDAIPTLRHFLKFIAI